MKTINDIIRYITIEINDVNNCIHDRADINEIAYDKLYDLDNNPYNDAEDRENQEYDLGRYRALTELLEYAKKDS